MEWQLERGYMVGGKRVQMVWCGGEDCRLEVNALNLGFNSICYMDVL